MRVKKSKSPSNASNDSNAAVVPPLNNGRRALFWISVMAVIAVILFIVSRQQHSSKTAHTVTYSREIAPIVYQHCAECHNPAQSAPFSLLGYDDVFKHSAQIQKVVQNGSMPPWLPEAGCGEFLGERRLSAPEKNLFAQWIRDGAKEGDPKDLPPPPALSGEWQLGPPDLILEMPQAFTLGAEGPDMYRSFVLPVSATGQRFVAATEVKPGTRAVHHAFVYLDRQRSVRTIEKDPAVPGVSGITAPTGVESLGGNFNSWQPGKRVYRAQDGFGWTLPPDADMVVQCHLRPTGKPEQIKLRLGLYFTQSPPTQQTLKGLLRSLDIHIPAGKLDYVVSDQYIIPVDVDLLAFLPHCHFLGKDLRADAEFPNGEKRCLFHIPRWDFNWQGDYVLKNPLRLPSGTRVSMHYVFDNSAANPANPYSPPRAVEYGPESTDEMAEFWFQILPVHPEEYKKLATDFSNVKGIPDSIAYNSWRLSKDPNDARAHFGMSTALIIVGKYADAETHLRLAIAANPQYDEAHFQLGYLFALQNQRDDAIKEMTAAIQVNPKNFKAHNGLGSMLESLGDLKKAEAEYEEALRLNPGDPMAISNLQHLRRSQPKK